MVKPALKLCSISILMFAFVAARPVRAAVDEAQGKIEFEQATRYFDAEEYEAALPHFQRAYLLSGRRPATIFALAQCERSLKMYTQAITHFDEYLKTEPSEEDAADVRETLKLLRELEAKAKTAGEVQEARGVTVGIVAVSSQPSGAQITIDAAPTGLLTPAELRAVGAGEHRILVDTEDAFGEAHVVVEPGKTTNVDVPLKTRPCLVEINTVPSGATISINGREAGKAPLTTEVAPGSVEISASTSSGQIGKANVVAKPSRTPKQVSLMLIDPQPPPPPAGQLVAVPRVQEREGISWGWLLVWGLMVGSGLALDLIPGSARNERVDGLDFVPVGLYTAGAISALIGVL